MKHVILSAFFCFLLGGLFAQDSTSTAVSLTLKDCIEAALKNNLTIRNSEYSAENAGVNWQQTKAQLLPSINSSIYHGKNQGRNINPYTNTYTNQSSDYASYGLSGSLNLFNGFAVQNAIRQYRLEYEAGKLDAQQQRDYITIQTILAYLSVLSYQDQLSLAKQQAAFDQQQVDRLSILNDEGAISPDELYNLKAQLATDQLNIVSTKNSLENAKISLAQFMNVDYNEDVVLERIGTEETPTVYDGKADDIYASAREHLALVHAAELHHQSAIKGLKSARGQYYPRIVLGGSVATSYSSTGTLQQFISSSDVLTDNFVMIDGKKIPVYTPNPVYSSSKIPYGDQWKNNFNTNINIGLVIPLLNGLQVRNQVKKAKILVDQTAFTEKTTKTQLRQSVEQAFINDKSAFDRYQTLNQQVSDLNESVRVAQIKFENGVFNSVEFLTVKLKSDVARANLVLAKYDYILRSKILDYYQSKPLW